MPLSLVILYDEPDIKSRKGFKNFSDTIPKLAQIQIFVYKNDTKYTLDKRGDDKYGNMLLSSVSLNCQQYKCVFFFFF